MNGKTQEDQILELAVKKGLLSVEELEHLELAHEIAETRLELVEEGTRLERLLQNGRLTPEMVGSLRREVLETAPTILSGKTHAIVLEGAKEQTQALFELSGKEPNPSGNASKTAGWNTRSRFSRNRQAFPVAAWDRYEFLKVLGEGGMGTVFQARDRRLNRLVALKFIRGDNPQLVRRFLHEAKAQSQIEHPNICQVFEVGEVEEMPYIAMQFVDGKELPLLKDQLSLEQKILLVREISEALQAAHRRGIIHRDIKPANIVVEELESGGLRPVLMDFGLAQDTTANDGLTKTGTVMGTPAYMSPEQASGQAKTMDRRTDIYSLGAVLYELLTGRTPFVAETPVQMLLQVTHEEPPPVRKLAPTVPLDLETITLKCLEKAPERRYESAQALALDLQAYLDGEPIQARQIGWAEWLWLRVRKNKPLVALAGSAVGLVLLFGGLAVRTSWRAAEQARLAQQFGESAEKIEAMMRFSYLLPLHDTRRERTIAQEQMRFIQNQMNEAGTVAAGAGNYALGRGFLALHDFEKAFDHLSLAGRNGFQAPGLDFALGRVYGELYRQKLTETERLKSKALQVSQQAALKQDFLEPALRYLTAYQAKVGTKPREAAYVEGLVAFYRGDFPAALGKTHTAFENLPWFYEARVLEGDILVAQAMNQRQQGRIDEAQSLLEKAGQAFEAALVLGRSDASVYLANQNRWEKMMLLKRVQRKSCREELDRLLAESQRVLQSNPEEIEAHRIATYGYQHLALYLVGQNQDPRPALQQLEDSARKALELGRHDAKMLAALGDANVVRGEYETNQGLDPRASLRAAIDYFHQSLALSPNFSPCYNNLGIAYQFLADDEILKGEDPRPTLNRCIDSFEKSIETGGKDPSAYNNLGVIYQMKGEFEARSCTSPLEFYEKARRNFEVTYRTSARTSHVTGNLGSLYSDLADWKETNNQDPEPELTQAQTYYAKSLELFPDDEWVVKQQCTARLIGVRWALRKQQNPLPRLEEVEQTVAKLLSQNQQDAEALQLQGNLCLLRAAWLVSQQKPPTTTLQAGMKACEQALALNSSDAQPLVQLGHLWLTQAKAETGPARRQALERAESFLRKALERNRRLECQISPLLKEVREGAAAAA
ncbi:MAG: protein kinase [Blastocatellia bacterium]|nr:protein kinase [Blastocatellia bacterium]